MAISSLLVYLNTLISIVPASLALWGIRKSKYLAFNVLVVLTTVMEITVLILSLIGIENWLYVQFFLVIETFLVGVGISQRLFTGIRKNTVQIFFTVVGVLQVFLIWYEQNAFMLMLQNFTLLIYVSYALYHYVRTDVDEKILSSKGFWMIFGLWFFFLCNSLVIVFIEPIVNKSATVLMAQVYLIIMASINILTYCMFSLSFLCKHE